MRTNDNQLKGKVKDKEKGGGDEKGVQPREESVLAGCCWQRIYVTVGCLLLLRLLLLFGLFGLFGVFGAMCS